MPSEGWEANQLVNALLRMIREDGASPANSLPPSEHLAALEKAEPGEAADVAEAILSVEQSVSASTVTKIQFDSENFDPNNNFDTTNHQYVAPADGLYSADARFRLQNVSSGDRVYGQIFVNGSDAAFYEDYANAIRQSIGLSSLLKLSAGDVVDVRMFSSASSTISDQGRFTRFGVVKIA